ncbi:MAG: cytochrome C oxidase subunit IV family protein [Pseudohongiellaceae bacterium]
MRSLIVTYVSLLGLLALTAGLSFIPMGMGNLIANLGIAVAKVVLIALVFMQLRSADSLTRTAAVTGLVWLALLFWLTLNDYLTRT